MSKSAETIAETRTGKIEGYQRGGLCVFKGIPYAASPVGERRWLPPEPAEPWSGVREAQKAATIAPQNLVEIRIIQPREPEPQNEDCLYLNIYTPGIDDKRRPVLFWIHGGGFTIGSGSSPIYSGRTLSGRGDAVVVTINYRLGLLGFLNLNEVTKGKIPATGNEGLLDQIAALEWVRDNIAAFGGDPDNVTIFGESAGGMSVGCLLAAPQAQGLFHKAIPQSGAASTAHPLDAAAQVAEEFLDIVGLSAGDVDALRSLTPEKLLPAQQELAVRMMRAGRGTGLSLQPVIDGKTLPSVPLDAIKGGSAKKIPILVGTTLDEWKLLAFADQNLPRLDEAHLVSRFKRMMPAAMPAEMPAEMPADMAAEMPADTPAEYVEKLIEAYRKARDKRGAPTTPPELFVAIQTDRVFRIPAIRLAEVQQEHNQPAYNYLFTWRSPILGGALGACHALELGFLFGTYEEQFSGKGPAADALAKNIQDAWLAFARNGDPSCESLGKWPPYGERRETMILGEECHVEEAPYDEERRAWEAMPRAASGGL